MKNDEKTASDDLVADYKRWNELFEKGGQDPF